MITICGDCYQKVIESKKFGEDVANSMSMNNGNANVDIEKEKDLENNESKNLIEIIKLYEENVGMIYPAKRDWFIEVSKIIEVDLFKIAIEICIDKNNVKPSYLRGIIQKWINDSIFTINDLNKKEMEYKNRQSKGKKFKSFEMKVEDKDIDSKMLVEIEEMERELSYK